MEIMDEVLAVRHIYESATLLFGYDVVLENPFKFGDFAHHVEIRIPYLLAEYLPFDSPAHFRVRVELVDDEGHAS